MATPVKESGESPAGGPGHAFTTLAGLCPRFRGARTVPCPVMDRGTVILLTLVAYQVALLGLGLLAQRRTRDEADFLLGGRALGPLVAAISASASSSSVWTLLGVSGYAFAHGLSAVWIFPSCVGGFLLNWYLVAPRLRRHSAAGGSLTLTEVLAGPRDRPGRRAVVVLASLIILLSLVVYVAAQLQGAGKTFATSFEFDERASIVVGSLVIVAYTMLGGFWAASLTDTLQGLLMAGAALALPLAALVEVGGPARLLTELRAVDVPGYSHWTGGLTGAAAIGMLFGLLGIGFGYPGQPHVVNRFMALRDERAMHLARRYSIAWAVIVYAGMVVLGLCGRILLAGDAGVLADRETVFLATTHLLFPPLLAGIVIAGVLSAIMSTADSQLLVAAAAISHDLNDGRRAGPAALARSRLVVLALSALAVTVALYGDTQIFSQVLSAWTVMGAAFGPLLLVVLWRGPVSPRGTLAAMLTGVALAVGSHFFYSGGRSDRWIEQVVPYLGSGLVAVLASRRDRGAVLP